MADGERVRVGTTEVWGGANDGGFTDVGLKDVMLVLPGEQVRMLGWRSLPECNNKGRGALNFYPIHRCQNSEYHSPADSDL